jgi:hypothetical protein
MRIHYESDLVPDGRGLCCRQSRLTGVISTLVFGGMLIALPAFVLGSGGPWYVWASGGVIGLLVVPIVVSDTAARFRKTNWLMWVVDDRLWINLRSYETGCDGDPPTIVEIPLGEIAAVGQRVETYTTLGTGPGRTVPRRDVSLELCLHSGETEELKAALLEERRHPGRKKSWFGGGVSVTTRATHFPVSLPDASTIRITYRTSLGPYLSPRPRRVLAELEQNGVLIAEPARVDRAAWNTLGDGELIREVVRLADAGAKIDAVKVLAQARDMKTADARRLVQELSGGAPV